MALVDGSRVLIIGAGGKLLAAANAADDLAVFLRRFDGVDVDVVRVVVVGFAKPPAHDALLGGLAVEIDFNHDIQFDVFLLQGGPERLRLRQVAGKPVQKPALFGVVFLQAVEDHGDGDIVGNQFAAVDKRLGLFSQRGFFGDVLAEYHTRFNVGNPEFLLHDRALRAFAAAVGPKY